MNEFCSILRIVLFIFLFKNECEAFNFNPLRLKRDSHNQDEHKTHVKHWGYRNEDKSVLPHAWYKSHPKCYGKQQSPIDITFYSTEFDSTLTEIQISSQSELEEKWNITNNGHSVVYTPLIKEFSFVMKPENEEYKLLQMHFHWRGSEHFINGRKFAGELHMVHQSKNDSNRFAVLGFLIEQINDDNPLMQPIINKLLDVIKYKSSTVSDEISLQTIIPSKMSKYFRYSGSLTTPGCDEIVEWYVMDDPVLTLSENQLLEFQTLEDSHGYPILMNSRPIQKLNDRLVRRSFYKANLFLRKGYLQSASGYNGAHMNKSNYFGLIFFILFFLNF